MPADSPGPAGTWCPVCGLYWNVKGCTTNRCNDTGVDAEYRRRLAREGVVVPQIVGNTGEGPLVGERLTPDELLRRTEPAAPVDSAPFIASRATVGAPPRADSIPFIPSRPDIGAPPADPDASREDIRRVLASEIGQELADRALGAAPSDSRPDVVGGMVDYLRAVYPGEPPEMLAVALPFLPPPRRRVLRRRPR